MAQSNDAQEITITREFLIAKDTKVEIDFPVKFKVGHRTNANETAQMNLLYLTRFASNLRGPVVDDGKALTVEDVLTRWTGYELGAPREGTGQTLHDMAVESFAREYAKAHNMQWPIMSAFLPKGVSVRKASDEQKEQAQAKADEQLATVLAKFAASTQPAVVEGIARHEAEIKAKRDAAKAAVAPTTLLDASSLNI